MAGHFNVFRRYQKVSLAAVAIMAMLAFFVMPPLLMEGGAAVAPDDHIVVRWNGGVVRETDLGRLIRVRRALNQFLRILRVIATGEQNVPPPLPDDEKSVFDITLLAREAEANGIVAGDNVVNDFLGAWTGDRVTPGEIQGVIADLRKNAGVTEAELFNGLRQVILAGRLQSFFSRGTGFNSMPPAGRWDAFRKLEQSATVEVVPVVVEKLSGEVPSPSTAALERLYEQYATALPQARSTTPGFREPATARYDALVAPVDVFVAEFEAKVTDDEIKKFYEENKEIMFKKVEEPPADSKEPPATDSSAKELSEGKEAETNPPAGTDNTLKTAPPVAPSASERDAKAPGEPKAAGETKPNKDASRSVRSIHQVAFLKQKSDSQQSDATSAESEKGSAGKVEAPAPVPDSKKTEKSEDSAETPKHPLSEKPAPGPEAPKEPVQVKPLDEVRDDIRKRLAKQAAAKKVSEIFGAVTAKIAGYSDSAELAIGLGEAVPPAPDVMKIAAEYGLQGVRSEFVTPAQAAAEGGIGGSFQIAFSERFGVRQQQWAEFVLAPEAPRFRPMTTRGVDGSQYLSWKTEDRPEFTPPFEEIKPEVERVWRLLEARPIAKKRAQELAAAVTSGTLADSVKGRDGIAASKVGPFTWLTRGTAPFGAAPTLSDPDGVEMAGNAFMEAVFALEPGKTTIAWNEPETVCYAIQLVSFEPDLETLQKRFLDSASDPRRITILAEDEAREAYDRWMKGIESRNGVTWARSPRMQE